MGKACEVYVNCINTDGTLLYGGFYHLCGSILDGTSAWVANSPMISHWEESQAFKITDDFRISFQSQCHLLEKENFALPALQPDFSANIPWVLAEETFIEHRA